MPAPGSTLGAVTLHAAMIGQRVRRREDPALLTGRGRYAGDVRLPGMLHMSVVRSPLPHGELRGVDLGPALAQPGVVAAYAAADLPEATGLLNHRRPVLAHDRVRYQGEPVAVVVSESSYQAADAADVVVLDIEPLPGAGDVLAASRPDAVALHDGAAGNVAAVVERSFGDIVSAFQRAPVVVKARIRLARVAGAYLEPRTATAQWSGEEGLRLWTSTQTIFGVREQVAGLLGLESGRVRVLAEDVGGGFGAKGMAYPEEVLVAVLARRLGRPIQWVGTRSEDTATTAHSHGTVLDLELAASERGELRGLRVRALHDIGAYLGPGAGQADNIFSHLICAYRLPALDAEARVVYTNAVPSGFIRGGGREVGNLAIERVLDLLARRLGLDRSEVRRRNLISPGQMPYDTRYPRGESTVVYDGGDYPRLLHTALDAIGYHDVRDAPLGVGIACCVESTGIGVNETARVRARANGSVQAFLGPTPQGQGHRTSLAQVVAERLAWPPERVEVVAGDTALVPPSANSAGSRTAYEVGNAAALAATALRLRLLELAAERLEASPEDVDVGPDGAHVVGVPAQAVPLSDLVGAEGVEAEETFHSPRTFASGCHAALVDVDPETGAVEVVRYAIAHDSGRSINPLLVEGQLHGGFAHGLGYSLFEAAAYDEDGALRAASFLDYQIPSAAEVGEGPELHEVHSVVFGNPEGFKGVGESGTIPVPAAIASAVDDALHRRGIETFTANLPITPDQLARMPA